MSTRHEETSPNHSTSCSLNKKISLSLRIVRNDETVYFSIMEKGGAIYIMTNRWKTTLYIGVTSDLRSRVYEHKNHLYKKSFTAKYNLEYCVYFEMFDDIEAAIIREKEIKKWRREKKELLINQLNPRWKDLWEEIQYW